VELKPDRDPARFASTIGVDPTHLYSAYFTGFAAAATSKQVSRLKASPDVLSVSKVRVVARIPGEASLRQMNSSVTRRQANEDQSDPVLPSPQLVAEEIRRVRADESVTADIDGANDRRVNADIAILDGGVDASHPDLNVVGGYNCVGRKSSGNWSDRDGHGTIVAGLAAALDNEIGVVGVAPGARIHAIRVADEDGLITDAALLCGLDWLNRKAPQIEVANLSFSAEEPVATGPCRYKRGSSIDRMHFGVCRAVNRGVTVVAAAGNASVDVSDRPPASYEEAIAVSAIGDFDGEPGGLSTPGSHCLFPDDLDDHFAVFSNYGQPIDVAAPGICMTSTFPGELYAIGDGTSFATPLVSGGAALLMARRPSMKPAQVRAKILATAEPGPIPDDPDGFPEGILDVSTF
jgi:subtilisin family serine protease